MTARTAVIGAMVLLLSGCGSTMQVGRARYELSGVEAGLAEQYEREEPQANRCAYWAGRVGEAYQEHTIAALRWPASYFETLNRWTIAKRDAACEVDRQKNLQAEAAEQRRRRAEEERAAAERARLENEALIKAQAAEVWLETATKQCQATADTSCAGAPTFVDSEVRSRCVLACQRSREELLLARYVLAKSRCIERKAKVCVVEDLPPAAMGDLPAMTERCTRECRVELEAMATPVPPPPPPPVSRPADQPAPARPGAARPSGGGCAVQCCDGSCSPTCTTVHRGCCSHHGGVC